MAAVLLDLHVRTARFDPASVTLAVQADVPPALDSPELRGRLTGPRCRFTETIEIAYPLREQARSEGRLLYQVVIPEPNLWTPATPFLYEGTIELWERRSCADRAAVCYGIRQFSLGARGFRLNGRPFRLRAVTAERLTLDDALGMRQRDCNTVLLMADDPLPALTAADEIGLLVFWEAPSNLVEYEARLRTALRRASFAGVLVAPLDPTDRAATARRAGVSLIGWRAGDSGVPPPDADFHLCFGPRKFNGKPILAPEGSEHGQAIGEIME